MSPEPTAPKARPDLSALRMDRAAYEAPPRRHLGWVFVVLLLGGAAAWAWLAPAPFLLPKVETTTVQVVTPTEASTVLTATGYTYARDRAAVGSRVIGRVVELKVDEGDQISKGDVIAVLDSADLRAQIDQAKARLTEAEARAADAERENGRQQRLIAEGVVTQAAADSAATALAIAKAQVETAKAILRADVAQLDYTVIRAPLSGVVIERNVEVGEMVAPGGFTSQQSTGAIVRIAGLNSLEVEADINESYIARIKPGQPAEIKIDAVPDRKYTGHLRQIVPTADRQKAVVEVKVAIDDADERLVPDMSSTVTFLGDDAARRIAQEKPRIYVPKSAVGRSGATPFVYRVKDGILARFEIAGVDEVVDGKPSDRFEVTSGLSGGETIIKSGLEELKDGQKVRLATK